jgi:DNA repair photolyase
MQGGVQTRRRKSSVGTPEAKMLLKRVVSASRRQDMVGTDPQGLSDLLRTEHPPEHTHTVVIWTKNPAVVVEHPPLRATLLAYDQIFVHVTVTGMGATMLEPRVPPWESACKWISSVVELVGDPRRVRLRFDPIVHLELPDGGHYTNLLLFEDIAPAAREAGITQVTVSWMSPYPKVMRHLRRAGLKPHGVPAANRRRERRLLLDVATPLGMEVLGCCVPGWPQSACIDGRLLTELHPQGERCSFTKAKGQRPLCGCTHSHDIGWYAPCSHGCLYCYAQPKPLPLKGFPLPSAMMATGARQ